MELAELLDREGLDGDEILAWARERSNALVADLPDDLDLDSLLADMPKLKASSRASLRPPGSDAELLGEAEGEFEGLHTGDFDIVEAGAPESSHVEFETGPLRNSGALSQELEMAESAGLLDVEELEELDGEELMEFASGEYDIVEAEEEAPKSRPPATRPPPPPPSPSRHASAEEEEEEEEEEPDLLELARSSQPAEPAAPSEIEDAASFEIDMDLDP